MSAELSDPKIASKMPQPCGYKLLIALPEADEKTDGGIIKSAATVELEQTGSICGFVLAMGKDAYQDTKRFPNGPYCKVGDWILMRAYAGTRFKVDNQELRILNDDSVDAVIDDPRGVSRI